MYLVLKTNLFVQVVILYKRMLLMSSRTARGVDSARLRSTAALPPQDQAPDACDDLRVNGS